MSFYISVKYAFGISTGIKLNLWLTFGMTASFTILTQTHDQWEVFYNLYLQTFLSFHYRCLSHSHLGLFQGTILGLWKRIVLLISSQYAHYLGRKATGVWWSCWLSVRAFLWRVLYLLGIHSNHGWIRMLWRLSGIMWNKSGESKAGAMTYNNN